MQSMPLAPVFVQASSAITALGFDLETQFRRMTVSESGIHPEDSRNAGIERSWLGRVDQKELAVRFGNLGESQPYTRLEQMLLLAANQVQEQTSLDFKDPNTLVVLATTKGNIEDISPRSSHPRRAYLGALAQRLANFWNHPSPVWVVSNACASGLIATIVAARMLRAQRYDHALVLAGDVITDFVISGFQSFKALAEGPCRPYDAKRTGLNLGEGAAAMVLSLEKPKRGLPVAILGGASTNDANHISGPSRDGSGLAAAIDRSLESSQAEPSDIDFISAHGTATQYNDEMEGLAFERTGLAETPLNSLKGFFGHTLGGAGLVESVFAVESLRRNRLLPTPGYREHGVSSPVKVIRESQEKPLSSCLKTSSGFGGVNAAAVWKKIES